MASLLALPLAAQAAGASEATGDDDAALLAVREGVWRDWFGGRAEALQTILPEDFVGIGAGGGPGRTRAETIADSVAFASAGKRLTDLRFSDNRLQRLGNVTIIYCGFAFTVEDKAGVSTSVAGRATEVFFRSGSTWTHPGWHLDSGA